MPEGESSGVSESDSSHHGRFLPGTKIANRYRIVSLLGKGGMGEVWRAEHRMLARPAAAKLIRPEALSSNPGVRHAAP